jgi:hypothetical protein
VRGGKWAAAVRLGASEVGPVWSIWASEGVIDWAGLGKSAQIHVILSFLLFL